MLTADKRAALVERLRTGMATARDLDAAADELSRPRPRVEWTVIGGRPAAYAAGFVIWQGTPSTAAACIKSWRAAGFDVAEVLVG